MSTVKSLYVGVDLGGTILKGALVTSSGEIAHESPIDAGHKNDGDSFSRLLSVVNELCRRGNDGGRVAGIGIGVPGLVNRRTGRIEVLPSMRELSSIDVAAAISDQTGWPVVLDNDANGAAYGELQV